MSDLLVSSRRKLARANEHIDDLEQREKGFLAGEPFATVAEPDPEHHDRTVHKLKLVKELSPSFGDVVGDALFNLRAALDQAGYAIASFGGKTDSKSAYFPFGRDAAEFANNMRGRCKDIRWEFHEVFRRFQPYKGGNEILAALNDLCNDEKHRRVSPMAAIALRTGVRIEGTGYFSTPTDPVWDRSKQELELVTLDAAATHTCDFRFALYVAFDEGDAVAGRSVVAVLRRLSRIVDQILAAIEAEATRLGMVS